MATLHESCATLAFQLNYFTCLQWIISLYVLMFIEGVYTYNFKLKSSHHDMFSSSRIWLLPQMDDDYYSLRYTDPKEYFAGVRREWAFRLEESNQLRNDLIGLGAKLPVRDSLGVYPARNFNGSWGDYRRLVIEAVGLIREENNRMLLRRCRFYMLKLVKDSAAASGREMTFEEECQLLQNPNYLSDEPMSDEEATDDDDSE